MFVRRTLGLALIAVLVSPAAAAAYSDTGHDPDDYDFRPDIRSTTRVVGARGLSIIVRTYERWPMGREVSVEAPLDTNGTAGADATIVMVVNYRSRKNHHVYNFCFSKIPVEGGSALFPGQIEVHGDKLTCSNLHLGDLDPTKRIRWKVIGDVERAHPDLAPNDGGWYG